MKNKSQVQYPTGVSAEVELLQLKDFLTSSQPMHWCIYVDNGGETWRFDDYQEASNKFDCIPPQYGASLVLFTRIGTSVTFLRRDASS